MQYQARIHQKTIESIRPDLYSLLLQQKGADYEAPSSKQLKKLQLDYRRHLKLQKRAVREYRQDILIGFASC